MKLTISNELAAPVFAMIYTNVNSINMLRNMKIDEEAQIPLPDKNIKRLTNDDGHTEVSCFAIYVKEPDGYTAYLFKENKEKPLSNTPHDFRPYAEPNYSYPCQLTYIGKTTSLCIIASNLEKGEIETYPIHDSQTPGVYGYIFDSLLIV